MAAEAVSLGLNNSNQTCQEFPGPAFWTAYYIKLIVSSLGLVACLLVIILIVISKGYKRFVYRLVLYFMTSVLFQALSLILELIPVSYTNTLVAVRKGWDVPCAVFGFFDQVTLWIGNLIVLWILLYLLSIVWKLYHSNPIQTSNTQDKDKFSKVELLGLLCCSSFPLLFSWVPFIFHMYGLSGMWCWIKGSGKSCNDDQDLGMELMFTLYYGPLIVLMIFSVLSLLVIVIALFNRWMSVHGMVRRQYMRGIKEMALVMIYPLLYSLICILLVVNRVDSAIRMKNHEQPFIPLWIAHAFAEAFRPLLPPLAFLLHPSTWKNLVCVKKKEEDTEYFYVPPEDSDIDEGIMIRGTKQTNYGSILQ